MNKVEPKIEASWKNQLHREFQQPYFLEIKRFLLHEKKKHSVYPKGSNVFAAFNATPFQQVKVVILGQDPYHGPGQAHGLSFSVPNVIDVPPSLNNIYKELHSDIGFVPPRHGNLFSWAEQGVLLLNASLTVRAREAGSHSKIGWQKFTDAAIQQLSQHRQHVVFLLWGGFAKKKAWLIDSSKHLILKAAHPSPLSAYNGFFGCRHFSKTNAYLQQHGLKPINWSLPND